MEKKDQGRSSDTKTVEDKYKKGSTVEEKFNNHSSDTQTVE